MEWTKKDTTLEAFYSNLSIKQSPIMKVFKLWDPADKCLYYFTDSYSPSTSIGS
jgi:hypothetical protein